MTPTLFPLVSPASFPAICGAGSVGSGGSLPRGRFVAARPLSGVGRLGLCDDPLAEFFARRHVPNRRDRGDIGPESWQS
jgi:hypothetical protein